MVEPPRSPNWAGLSQKQRLVHLVVGLVIVGAVIGAVLLIAG